MFHPALCVPDRNRWDHAVKQIIITLEPVIRTDNCGRQLFLCTGAARQDEDGRTRLSD